MSGFADHKSDDVRHLWAAVLADPADDTARLVLADCVEEHGDPVRAAYIRAAVELHGLTVEEPTLWHERGPQRPGAASMKCFCAKCARLEDVQFRMYELGPRCRALLGANEAEWRRAGACPECDEYETGAVCPNCRGTKDRGGLAELTVPENTGDPVFRHRVTWERGFPAVVHAPLSDVFRLVAWPGNGARWVPTPTALAWVREWPLRAVEVQGPTPTETTTGWGWFRSISGAPQVMRFPYVLWSELWEVLPDARVEGHHWALYATEAGAVAALGRAVLEVLRAAVREKEGANV